MSTKTLISIIIVVLVVVGVVVLSSKKGITPASPVSTSTGTETETGIINTMPVPTSTTSSVTETQVSASINNVVFQESGFTPAVFKVKAGDTVTFRNESSREVWPASALHPTHTVYPTTGGCIGSTFDACRGLKPGESWSFKFDVPGEWGYHDHLNASYGGAIVVEK